MEETLETTLVPAIEQRGYWCFKLKLTGRDDALDVSRTMEAYRVAQATATRQVLLTIDTNEANPTVESVVDYLERLKVSAPAAFAALAYLEQPTSRDIRNHPFDWRPAAKYVPVMIDEGLTNLDVLEEARRQMKEDPESARRQLLAAFRRGDKRRLSDSPLTACTSPKLLCTSRSSIAS